jgi:hypothetical protein
MMYLKHFQPLKNYSFVGDMPTGVERLMPEIFRPLKVNSYPSPSAARASGRLS